MKGIRELLALCKNKRINFYFDDKDMYFERANFSKVDKMIDKKN